MYIHTKAILKVDGSFLFSLSKDMNKNNQKAFRSTGSDNNNNINKNNSFIPR